MPEMISHVVSAAVLISLSTMTSRLRSRSPRTQPEAAETRTTPGDNVQFWRYTWRQDDGQWWKEWFSVTRAWIRRRTLRDRPLNVEESAPTTTRKRTHSP